MAKKTKEIKVKKASHKKLADAKLSKVTGGVASKTVLADKTLLTGPYDDRVGSTYTASGDR